VSFGTGSSDVRETFAPGIEPGGQGAVADRARQDIGRESAGGDQAGQTPAANMLPGRERRTFGLERVAMRLIATCGIVAIGVALGAILVSSKVQGWITGLVIALVSVVLSAILWSSRQL
jgi:hypothetical protein